MAKVKDIQVCGGIITTMLSDACLSYLQDVMYGTDRAKLNFSVVLDDGTIKHITFRQEDNIIHVYGDFEGMPNALEWGKRILGESTKESGKK